MYAQETNKINFYVNGYAVNLSCSSIKHVCWMYTRECVPSLKTILCFEKILLIHYMNYSNMFPKIRDTKENFVFIKFF